MTTPRPSWLTEPCPSWCVGEHDETDQPADRMHQGITRHVPVVLLERYSDATGHVVRDVAGAEFDIVRYRYLDGQHDWLYIGDNDHQLDVSFESAQRLRAALAKVLDGNGLR